MKHPTRQGPRAVYESTGLQCDPESVIFDLPGYRVIDAADLPLGVRRVLVKADQVADGCPTCGMVSGRVHLWLRQRVKDIPIPAGSSSSWSNPGWCARSRPAHGELTDSDKRNNTAINRVRYLTERIIVNLKTWRVLHTDYRRPYRTFETTIQAVTGLIFAYTQRISLIVPERQQRDLDAAEQSQSAGPCCRMGFRSRRCGSVRASSSGLVMVKMCGGVHGSGLSFI